MGKSSNLGNELYEAWAAVLSSSHERPAGSRILPMRCNGDVLGRYMYICIFGFLFIRTKDQKDQQEASWRVVYRVDAAGVGAVGVVNIVEVLVLRGDNLK